tara:strand:- start:984 stop:1520 length:537 start_codon:yes stop_codon:yes gene_type:complete
MAGQRLTDKTALTEQVGSGDLLMVVDVNDTTGSAAGTSKKMDFKYLLQTDKISVSNAEVLDLDANEKVLVGALSGYMINVVSVTVLTTYAASTESSRKALIFGFDDGSDSFYWSVLPSCMDSVTQDVTYITQARGSASLPALDASILNKPFVCWAEGTGFNGGWSMDVYVTYSYTKIL